MKDYLTQYYTLLRIFFITVCMILCYPLSAYSFPSTPEQSEEEISIISWEIDSLKEQLLLSQADTLRVKRLIKLGARLKDIDSKAALLYVFEALKIVYSPTFSQVWVKQGKAQCYTILGMIYSHADNHQQALYYALQALTLFREMQQEKASNTSLALITVAREYLFLKQYDFAIKYYEDAITYEKEYREGSTNIEGLYVELATCYDKKKDYAKSTIYYDIVLKDTSMADKSYHQLVALMNISTRHLNDDKLDSALYYLYCALNRVQSLSNIEKEYPLARCYGLLGITLLKQHKLNEAEQYLLKSYHLTKNKDFLRDMSVGLSDVYEKKGNINLALKYRKLYDELYRSIVNEDITRQMSNMQASFDMKKKDQQIELLNQRKEIAETKMKREEWFRNSLMIVVVLVLVVCFSLYRNVRQKQKTNYLLGLKNEQIETQRLQIEEKNNELNSFNKELIKENIVARYEVLKSKVNPHFLFNTLTTLSSLVIKDGNAALEFTDQFAKLYRMILETGNRKYVDLYTEMKIVNHYLYLEKIRFGDNLIVDTHIDKLFHRAYVPPFSVQMVVENAIKHNKILDKEKLRIDIYTEDDCIVVKNNLQDATVAYNSTLTGQKNIIDRYKLSSNLQPSFIKTATEYEVKLPLIKEEVDVV